MQVALEVGLITDVWIAKSVRWCSMDQGSVSTSESGALFLQLFQLQICCNGSSSVDFIFLMGT